MDHFKMGLLQKERIFYKNPFHPYQPSGEVNRHRPSPEFGVLVEHTRNPGVFRVGFRLKFVTLLLYVLYQTFFRSRNPGRNGT